MARKWSLAQAYLEFVDEGVAYPPEELEAWIAGGADEWINSKIEGLIKKWVMIDRYVELGLPDGQLAKRLRQIARSSASWMLRITESPPLDFSFNDRDGLKPSEGSDEQVKLNHRCTTLDLSSAVERWRETAEADLLFFVNMCHRALGHSVVDKSQKTLFNKMCNALKKELHDVDEAAKADRAIGGRVES